MSISCVPTDVLCVPANACARTSDTVRHPLAWPSILQASCQGAASFRFPFPGKGRPIICSAGPLFKPPAACWFDRQCSRKTCAVTRCERAWGKLCRRKYGVSGHIRHFVMLWVGSDSFSCHTLGRCAAPCKHAPVPDTDTGSPCLFTVTEVPTFSP